MKITVALTQPEGMGKFELDDCLEHTLDNIRQSIVKTRTKTHHQGKVYAYLGEEQKETAVGLWNVEM